jgi:hypothetical protein
MRCTTCLAQYPQHKQIRESKILQEAFHLAFHEEFSRDENHYNKLLLKTTCGCIETRLPYTLTTTMSAGWLIDDHTVVLPPSSAKFSEFATSISGCPESWRSTQNAASISCCPESWQSTQNATSISCYPESWRSTHPSVAVQKVGNQLGHLLSTFPKKTFRLK